MLLKKILVVILEVIEVMVPALGKIVQVILKVLELMEMMGI
jgi:hypothetical protein